MLKSEFINKYKGKSVEYDGVAMYQCVDYIKLYLNKCYGIKPGSWGDAKQYYLQFNNKAWGGYTDMHKYFTRIPAYVKPQFGDIVVWNGTYGHIAIASGESDSKGFYCYEQNWNNKKCVEKNRHYYSDVLGVLRPKFWTVTAQDGLNVRSVPSTNCPVIKTLKYGTVASFTAYNDKWKELDSGGYCYSKYLD